MKKIQITDTETGKVIMDESISDFQLQYTKLNDSEGIYRLGRIQNGRIGEKWRIKNYLYSHIAEKLVKKFPELQHICPSMILFIENTEWTPKAGTTKRPWIARIGKANNWLELTWKYWYVMESRSFYTDEMSTEQIIGLIYHELRHIDKEGNIIGHDIEDWDNMVATLGKDWATTKASIPNLLDDDFPDWSTMPGSQLSIFKTAEPEYTITLEEAIN